MNLAGTTRRGLVFALLCLFAVTGVRALAAANTPVGKSPPAIIPIDPPESGFFAKRLSYEGIPIKAPANVVDGAGRGGLPKSDWKSVMWGGQHSTTIRPRQALKEFIPRCLERGLLSGLSTWFFGPGVDRVVGVDGFVRVWDQTLEFLKENDLVMNGLLTDQTGYWENNKVTQ
jgi:hypothetical protein